MASQVREFLYPHTSRTYVTGPEILQESTWETGSTEYESGYKIKNHDTVNAMKFDNRAEKNKKQNEKHSCQHSEVNRFMGGVDFQGSGRI